jgi:peptidoglycan biosynthesis protein MviN/MurJ (putative lipid II flippase)
MVVLATLLCFIAILASHNIKERTKSYYILILILETAMLGVFMARDWSLFYVFWESTLIPLFFLIDRWGGKGHQAASLNFVLYTMGGSVFMLISLLVLFDSTPGHSFAMDDMMAGAQNLPVQTQILIFLGFLIGFGVKMPIFPMHGWLPLAHVEAPSPVSILLSGILLKMGSYGLIHIAGLLPFGIAKLFSLWLYATHRQGEAAKIAAKSLGVNILFSLLLIAPMAAPGLALASSISGWVLLALTLKAIGDGIFLDIMRSKYAPYAILFIGVATLFSWGLKAVIHDYL